MSSHVASGHQYILQYGHQNIKISIHPSVCFKNVYFQIHSHRVYWHDKAMFTFRHCPCCCECSSLLTLLVAAPVSPCPCHSVTLRLLFFSISNKTYIESYLNTDGTNFFHAWILSCTHSLPDVLG